MIPIKNRKIHPEKEKEKERSQSSPKNENSDFFNLLKTAKKKELQALAQLLSPYIAEADMRQPRVWGNKERLHLEEANIAINDLLINTRSGHVTIKKNCFFGHRCMLLTGNHDYSKTGFDRLTAVPDSGRDILIEQGVWLGSGVTVLGPCHIGENAVIAAGSLVIDDVPANTIVAGHPAKPVRYIDGTPYDQ